MKKVAIIGTVGIPARYGGFETLAHHLTKHLKDEFEFTVYCSKKAYQKEERVSEMQGAKLVYLPLNANGAQSVIYDIVSMIHALFYADTLVVLGVSGGLFLPIVKWFTTKKIIVNIDGLEWRRNKWNGLAKWFLKLSESVAVKYAHAQITDNQAIKNYTYTEYGSVSELIEYGGDHAVRTAPKAIYLAKYDFMHAPYAFKVARIEPENNVHVILNAFTKVTQILVVVGNWNNSEYGKNLKEFYSVFGNLHLLDPIYDQEELDAIRQGCQVYVHGHSAGGTNPSLVEAMHLELPILAFDVSYNRATTENQAFYFTDETDLAQQVLKLTNTPLQANAKRMVAIAKRRYTWSVIADKYKKLIYAVDYQTVKPHIFPSFSVREELNNRKGMAQLQAMHYLQKEES